MSIWHSRSLCRWAKIWIFKSLIIPVLLYGCETWTLNIELKRRIDVFGNKCLHKIMGYCLNDFVSNQWFLCETESSPITSIVRQQQLRLYGHVARYPKADSACQVVSERDNLEWRRPRGHQQSSWLGQVNASCWELLSMGRGPAWRLAQDDHWGWHWRVGEMTCHLGVYLQWLIDGVTVLQHHKFSEHSSGFPINCFFFLGSWRLHTIFSLP